MSETHPHVADDQLEPSVRQALAMLDEQDSLAAAAVLTQPADPLQAARGFAQVVRELNSKRRLAEMLWLGRSGIEFSLRMASVDTERTAELRTFAIKLSYNISANVWPGWADEGVHPTRSDLLLALDVAKVHRRLVGQYAADLETLGNACWLVGAQALANEREQQALHEFEAAAAQFEQAGKTDYQQMSEGYQGLAMLCLGRQAGEGRKRLESALVALAAAATDDAAFFADQLRTAERVFLHSGR